MLLLMLDKGRFTAILLGGAVAICKGKNAWLKYEEKKKANDESQTEEIQSGIVARSVARIHRSSSAFSRASGNASRRSVRSFNHQGLDDDGDDTITSRITHHCRLCHRFDTDIDENEYLFNMPFTAYSLPSRLSCACARPFLYTNACRSQCVQCASFFFHCARFIITRISDENMKNNNDVDDCLADLDKSY